ncbi:MAG: hypothetical protein HC777_03975, partial [Hyphomonadaceae bacterium]|nr:hypothetical protein [Hyphomonadaceae bacterium]
MQSAALVLAKSALNLGHHHAGNLLWALSWCCMHMDVTKADRGATSGRTTLAGEGLQHQDGNSHVLASVVPNCLAYDPAFAYEIAVLIREGIRRMYEKMDD